MRFMKIKILLPLLFGITVILGLVQGGVAMSSLTQMKSHINEIANERLPKTVMLGDMRLAVAEVRRAYAVLVASYSPDEIEHATAGINNKLAARDQAFAAYASEAKRGETKALIDDLNAKTAAYDVLAKQLVTLKADGKLLDVMTLYTGGMNTAATEMSDLLDQMITNNSSVADVATEQADQASNFAQWLTIVVALLALTVSVSAAVMSTLRIAKPIDGITGAMKKLAGGDIDSHVPYAERTDEIGDMAAAVEVFRQNAIERVKLERDAEANRSLSETQRKASEEQKASEAAEIQFAVDQLGNGLSQLSDGDLSVRLDTAFTGSLDQLRNNFNDSVSKLNKALSAVGENARGIDAGAQEILSAANDLSKRTEQQASSIEQTAAALEEVTTGVKDSAVRAEDAGQLVANTRTSAEQSGKVVADAIDAMNKIEKSSGEISNIISVIDDIAFQTNLLALNAGVEAARAGEAGKGFAVVAQEVRELAQRSANAAKEIKALITTSGVQVHNGVQLVRKTGEALSEIAEHVQQINGNVSAIVTSAREQSTGLQEINVAVNLMDQGTQQNAAMVEQSTAASHSLAQQAATLNQLLAQFRLDGRAATAPKSAVTATAGSRPAPSPARELGRRISSAFGGSAAAQKIEAEWTEF